VGAGIGARHDARGKLLGTGSRSSADDAAADRENLEGRSQCHSGAPAATGFAHAAASERNHRPEAGGQEAVVAYATGPRPAGAGDRESSQRRPSRLADWSRRTAGPTSREGRVHRGRRSGPTRGQQISADLNPTIPFVVRTLASTTTALATEGSSAMVCRSRNLHRYSAGPTALILSLVLATSDRHRNRA
jgi:hypothetical protein